MGKGDRKTRRGKLFMGSFGVRRPRKKRIPFQSVSKGPSEKGKSPGGGKEK